MRIKINDKIYRLKEIESGVDSLMEMVEEPKYKDGDFLHSDWADVNITIIFKNQEDGKIYYHASKSDFYGIAVNDDRYWRDEGDFRPAIEEEKQGLLDALAKRGKRWNAEKKCIEDIPVQKFKKGDLAIFWDEAKEYAAIRFYERLDESKEYLKHIDQNGSDWENAIKFESKEQYEKLIKGEL